MLAEFWPIFALAAAVFIVTRPRVWYWAAALPWRLTWRLIFGRKR
jgi:hypothetical protein